MVSLNILCTHAFDDNDDDYCDDNDDDHLPMTNTGLYSAGVYSQLQAWSDFDNNIICLVEFVCLSVCLHKHCQRHNGPRVLSLELELSLQLKILPETQQHKPSLLFTFSRDNFFSQDNFLS